MDLKCLHALWIYMPNDMCNKEQGLSRDNEENMLSDCGQYVLSPYIPNILNGIFLNWNWWPFFGIQRTLSMEMENLLCWGSLLLMSSKKTVFSKQACFLELVWESQQLWWLRRAFVIVFGKLGLRYFEMQVRERLG